MSSDIKNEGLQYRTGELSDLGNMIRLMTQSAVHREWSLEDLTRLVIPPLELKQVIVFTETDQTVGWASIAWLSSRAQSAFTKRTRKLQPTDWNSGPWLWVIDVVAPLGHGMAIALALRRYGKSVPRLGRSKALRTYANNKRSRYFRGPKNMPQIYEKGVAATQEEIVMSNSINQTRGYDHGR